MSRLATFLLLAATAASVSAYTIVVPRAEDQEFPGGPGMWPEPDIYNTYPDVDWNRTYGAFEPQQIHLSLADEAKYARIEFATLSPADHAVFKYWPKKTHIVASEIIHAEVGHLDRLRYKHNIT